LIFKGNVSINKNFPCTFQGAGVLAWIPYCSGHFYYCQQRWGTFPPSFFLNLLSYTKA
jgi:hypothetical protein